MSKFSNLLSMIILLKSKGKMKTKELAEALEVSDRRIRDYKQDLEMAGVYIESYSGNNGGYVLKGYDYLVKLDVEEDEYFALQVIKEQLRNSDFIYTKEFDRLCDKINIVYEEKNKSFELVDFMIKDVKNIDSEKDKKKCIDVNRCIALRNKMNIRYFSLNSGEKERVIHPYAILTYKGAFYMVAYCESRRKILEFKLSRIKDYTVLEEKYYIDKAFSLREYMKNSIGLYKDETLKLRLQVYKPMSYIVSEKLWVDNQKIKWVEDESIIFEAEMQGKTEVISWILSMGSKVKVLEPEHLASEVKEEVNKMISM